jgi:large subunit ribosomal protein L7/L12
MADLKKLAEEIVGLTLLEAQELKTILKDEYGIEPAAGGAVMMAGPAGGDAGAAAEEEQTEFDVILKSPAHRRSTSSRKCARSPVWA